MRTILAAIAVSTTLTVAPAFAAHAPLPYPTETAVKLPSVSELNVLLQTPATAKAASPQQLALADGCGDPWWHRSGWQMVAEFFFNVC